MFSPAVQSVGAIQGRCSTGLTTFPGPSKTVCRAELLRVSEEDR